MFLFVSLCNSNVIAQSLGNYTFVTNNTGSLTADKDGAVINMSTGTTEISLAGGALPNTVYHDDDASTVINLPFSFGLLGNVYDRFSLNSNGQVKLGNATDADAILGGAISAPASNTAYLAPISGDNAIQSNGKVHTKVFGTAPNRVFVIEFVSLRVPFSGTVSTGSQLQARLYESGAVEYVYGVMYNNSASSVTRSVALSTSNTATTSAYIATITTTPTNTLATTWPTSSFASATAMVNLNGAADGARRVFRWTPPPIPVAATGINFTAVSGSSVTINWTDNANNESGYRIYKSTDNVNFVLIATTAANATSYQATGLAFATSYTFRVTSYNEAGNGANLDGTQATPAAGFSGGATAGVVTVGTGGDYLNLTSAFAAINAGGLINNIDIKLLAGYPAAAETYPIVGSTGSAAGAFSIKLYPTVAGLSITSANSTGTLNLNSTASLTIDGRVNQAGAKNLVISNTSATAAAYAIQFVNDASNNTIKNAIIKSANTGATSGTIVLGAGNVTGNDGNIIDNCNILDDATTPVNGIYSAGSSTGVDNSGNSVTNCNIANYFGAATASNGIFVASNSAAWTISGNKFYQTASRTATTGTPNKAIQIVTASGGGYTINGNIIGYANASGTGTTTYAGAVANKFTGIDVTAANTPVSNIQGNTISNISVSTSNAGTAVVPVFGGIIVQAGSVNIGNVTANVIGAATGTGAVSVTSSVNGFFVHGIYVASTGTVNISNNTIGSITNVGAAAANGCQFAGIWGLGSGANFTIQNNLIGSTSTANSISIGTDLLTTVGSANQYFYGIRCDATGTVVVGGSGVGNTVQNITNRSSGAAVTYGYYNGNTAASASYTYNTLSAITMGWSTTAGTGAFYGLYNASTVTGVLSISNNTFQNITNLNTTGSIYLVYSSSSSSPFNFQNNVFNNIVRVSTATSGTFYGYYNGGSPTGVQTISNNSFTNITTGVTSGSSGFYGIYNFSSSSSTWNIFSNTFTGLTTGSGTGYVIYNGYGATSCYNNIINNITGAGTLYGIYTGTSVTTGNVYANVISALATSGASSTLYGMHLYGGTAVNYYNNKIYDLTASGAAGVVYGMYTGGGTAITLYNNLVGDLKAPASSLTAPAPSVAGLYISSGTTVNAYYNTFSLSGTSTGANFGTATVYSTATPTTVNLRNNIFNNLSVPTGTGRAAAYQRASTVLTNYANTSNNNLFYSGTPGPNNVIYFDGTNADQTIAAFKVRMVTRDQSSVTESPNFVSTVGSNPGFLHINTAISTLIESGAAPITGFTTDFDGDSRNATTPDIGADEFAGTPPSAVVINSVSITPTGNQCTATARTVTANLTNGASDVTSVTLNYTFNGGAQVSVAMTGGVTTPNATSTWTGTIPAATPTNANVNWSVTATDAITSRSTSGPGYKDDPLLSTALAASATSSTVCSGSPDTLSLKIGGSVTYCTPVYTTTQASGDFISGVTVGNLSNTGTNDAPTDYTYYSNLTLNVVANGTTQVPVSLQAGGASSLYAQLFRIFIDYNRNGTFEASESVFVSTSAVFGSSMATGNFVVPTTANNGLTRMRVVSKYSTAPLATESCNIASDYGEVEDYNVNITGGTATVQDAPVVWSDGTNTVGTTNPLVVSPTATTTYTATITFGGCTKTSNPVTITTSPLPAAPGTAPSNQCGNGVPTVFASGGTPGNYRWYLTPTGGTALLNEYNLSLQNYSISQTTTFYVSIAGGSCESARTAAVATVNLPDAIQASASSNSVCTNSSFELSVQQTGSANVYSYTWTASPAAGSGIPTSLTGPAVMATPTAAGTYIYTVTGVDGSCTTSSSITVTVNPLPTIVASAPVPATVCAGANVVLSATSTGPGTAVIGAGVNSASGYNAPFYSLWSNKHSQIMVTAGELAAAGLSGGNITSVTFYTTAVDNTNRNIDLTIKIGATNATSMAAFITSGLTQVYTTPSYTQLVGQNVLPFATPFAWDGVSNIVVDLCFGNAASGATLTSTSPTDPTSYVSVIKAFVSSATASSTACANVTSGVSTFSARPRLAFSGTVASSNNAALSWVWNPAT